MYVLSWTNKSRGSLIAIQDSVVGHLVLIGTIDVATSNKTITNLFYIDELYFIKATVKSSEITKTRWRLLHCNNLGYCDTETFDIDSAATYISKSFRYWLLAQIFYGHNLNHHQATIVNL